MKRARVLIVDDDAQVGGVLTRCLAREHDVTCCRSGQEALQRLTAGQNFDVIFCDLMMPTMTGVAFYAEFEARWPAHCDKIVFMTGGAFSPSTRKFLEDTSVECIDKPFAVASVRAMVRRMMK